MLPSGMHMRQGGAALLALLLAMGAAAAGELEGRLVGAWLAQTGTGADRVLTRLTFSADGTFVEQSYGAATPPLYSWGRWAMSDVGGLERTVSGWRPQQACTS